MKIRLTIVAAIVIAALGVAGLVYAFTVAHRTTSTGTFGVAAETTNVQVITYDINTGLPLATPAWCEAANFQPNVPMFCMFAVENLTTSTAVSYAFSTASFVNADGKNLASKISVTGYNGTNVQDISACRAGTASPVLFGPTFLNANPHFGDATGATTTGNLPILAGVSGGSSVDKSFVCLKLVYDGTPAVFNASTSAVFAIDARDP